jgi:hypothetical protein
MVAFAATVYSRFRFIRRTGLSDNEVSLCVAAFFACDAGFGKSRDVFAHNGGFFAAGFRDGNLCFTEFYGTLTGTADILPVFREHQRFAF